MNGQRKSLAAQIDRLDSILDALSDGLNQSVQTVVEQVVERVVGQAVQTAVATALADPAVRSRLNSTSKPTGLIGRIARSARWAWDALCSLVCTAWRAVTGLACRAGSATAKGVRLVGSGTRSICTWTTVIASASRLRIRVLTHMVQRVRKPLLVSMSVGLTISVACFVAGPFIASMVSGLCASLLAALAQALRPVWRALAQVRGEVA